MLHGSMHQPVGQLCMQCLPVRLPAGTPWGSQPPPSWVADHRLITTPGARGWRVPRRWSAGWRLRRGRCAQSRVYGAPPMPRLLPASPGWRRDALVAAVCGPRCLRLCVRPLLFAALLLLWRRRCVCARALSLLLLAAAAAVGGRACVCVLPCVMAIYATDRRPQGNP